MSQRVLRRRRFARTTNHPDAGLQLTIVRAQMPVVSGVHAAYPLEVATGERRVDRAEWAAVVREQMAKETKGKKEPFARLLGINTRTLSRWLDREVDVSEEYVRNFARTFDIGTSALLIRVGFYQHGELHQAGPTAEEIEADPALRVIEESDHPPSVKARMRQRLYELRAKRRAEEVDEVRWWLDHARGA